jgi:hypothetical protein
VCTSTGSSNVRASASLVEETLLLGRRQVVEADLADRDDAVFSR